MFWKNRLVFTYLCLQEDWKFRKQLENSSDQNQSLVEVQSFDFDLNYFLIAYDRVS